MQGNEHLLKIDCNVPKDIFSNERIAELDSENDKSNEKSFPCETCQVSFCALSSLTDHFRDFHVTQTTKTSYLCGLCQKTFKSFTDIKKHFHKEHMGQKKDVKCKEKISFKHPLYDLSRSPTNVKYCCYICYEEFSSKKCLTAHQRNHSEEELADKCTIKEPGISDRRKIEKTLICEICGKGFTRLSELKCHVRQSHVSGEDSVCKFCDAELSSTFSLKRHILRFHAEENINSSSSSVVSAGTSVSEEAFNSCDALNKKDITKFVSDLPKNVSTGKSIEEQPKYSVMQNTEKTYLCKACQNSFPDILALKKHLRFAHRAKRYACDVCEMKFVCKRFLYTHYQTHLKIKYRCDICQKVFAKKDYLAVHKRIHSGERPYSCVFCKETFISSSKLKVHLRTHSGEKPYVCITCGKGFVRNDYLKRHERVHTGAQQIKYRCDICKKVFAKKDYLAVHKRIHTGERPYSCKFCNETFISSSKLKGHLKTHPEEKPLA